MAGLPWIKLDVVVPNHPKLQRLERALEIEDGLGVAVRLWCWTATYYPLGEIPIDAEDQIAKASIGHLDRNAIRNASPRYVTDALVTVGLLERHEDRYEVHGWSEHQQAHADKAARESEQNRERQRRFRNRQRNVTGAVTHNVTDNVTVTQSNGGEESRVEEKKEACAEASPAPVPAAGPLEASTPPAPTREVAGNGNGVPMPQDDLKPPRVQQPAASGSRSAWDRVNGTWESVCVPAGYAKARGTDKQRKGVAVRCRDPSWPEAFEAACRFLAAEPFYRGQNDRGWAATLSWVLQPGKAEELAERAGTRKVRKESPEDAAMRRALEAAERRYESGETADAYARYGTGPGGEGGPESEAASLPLPDDGASVLTGLGQVLGDRWAAGVVQDAARLEHGGQYGAPASPSAVRVARDDAG